MRLDAATRRNLELTETLRGEPAPTLFSRRPAFERAILAFANPTLYPPEQEFLRDNRFKVETLPFDWTLNER